MLLYALLPIFLSAVCSFVISKCGIKSAFIDKPNERSSHSTPTPRGGGIGMLLAFIVVGFLFIQNHAIVSVVGCAGILGLLEDRFTFSSQLRLFIQTILSILAIVFISDSSFYCRLRNGENLMQSHRGHLYQYMCNELAIPHWKVSSLYATVQLILGVLSLFAYSKGLFLQFAMLGILIISFIGIYRVVKGVK